MSMIILMVGCMLLGTAAALIGIFYNYLLRTSSTFYELSVILADWAENEGGFKGWIAKQLGACIFRSTTWITIFLMVIYWLSLDNCPNIAIMVICTLASIGVQHLIIRIFVELDDRK